jgi:polysaccharide deacetylase family protein (PEP-CTERM system associated)
VSAPGRPTSAFSVDVEDYFHVEAFSKDVSRDAWPSYPSRVVRNTAALLDLLDRYHVRGTFFVLGWVAQREPALVREIRDRGHEIGCHSLLHRLIYRLTPDEFREDTKAAKDAIERAAGCEVAGYRAPTFSITPKSLWAVDVLAECGFRFDSSIYPIHHDNYGMPGSPRAPYAIRTANGGSGSGRLAEFPISAFRMFGRDLPVAGGGYLRMLPWWYNRAGIDRILDEPRPAMVYVHPWEIDPDQPRIHARLRSRLRHYTNLAGMQARLERLLQRYAFAPVGDVLAQLQLPDYRIDRERGALVAAA